MYSLLLLLPEADGHELGDKLDEGHVGAARLAAADLLAEVGVRARHLHAACSHSPLLSWDLSRFSLIFVN